MGQAEPTLEAVGVDGEVEEHDGRDGEVGAQDDGRAEDLQQVPVLGLL